jgi:small GTP-binding protein
MQDDDDKKLFDKIYEEKTPDFKGNVNIAVIGTVSSGKSSLINAILERGRENAVAEVGATSGVTTDVKPYKIDDHVLIIDAPGLDDIKKQNSDETVKLLQHIDIGILVVTGSADTAQKKHYDALKEKAEHVFVVLNKSDAWEHLNDSALQGVVEQWKTALGASKIYPTVTKGYDKEAKKDIPLDLRGVDELRDDILNFLKKNKKDILFAKNLGDKKKYASGIIAAALTAVAVEAFVPGSAAYITATQVIAITSLHYVYTGEMLSKQSALTLLPRFAGQSLGSTIFLWAKSILPPTGIVDFAAAGIAVSITFAMLASVNYLLSNNLDILNKGTELMDKFNQYKAIDISGILKALKENQSIRDIVSKMIS